MCLLFYQYLLFHKAAPKDETAVLYGRRFIANDHSYSFSFGVSLNNFNTYLKDSSKTAFRTFSKYCGLPFEANIKWFKKEKRRLRIYGLIPVGRPTALGGSIGFKIFGNISNTVT